MEEVGNAGFPEWLRPPVSDSEVLLLTSFNGHQLENCMGASLLTRKESAQDVLGVRQINHGGDCDGEVDSSRLRAQSEAVIPYDYYSDGEYPVLIHTRQASDMFERYVDPFRINTSFDARPGIGADIGQAVKFVPDMDAFEQKSVSLFPQSGTREDGILQENLNKNAREEQVCDAACTEEYEIQKECPNDNARGDEGSDAVSRDRYEIENQRKAGMGRENQPCNAQGDWPVLSETSRDLELAEKSKVELCQGISFEMSSNQVISNLGSVEDFEIKKDCSNKIARESDAFYAGSTFLKETSKDLEVVAEKPERQLCPDMSGKMDFALETEGEATMNQGDAILAQTPLEIYVKPIVSKSFMRRKANSSRKRVSRKNSGAPNLEEFVSSSGGGADLLITNKSEGPATSTCPEADVIDEPIYSSSLVPSTELPTDGSNEGSLKYQSPSEATNTDGTFAIFLSNKNTAGEISGRSTRSRAHGKICKKPIVQDSLFDKSNSIFSNKMTGKRSTICKTVRSTIWGDLENLKEGPEKKGKTLKSEPSSLHTELDRTNIEAEVLQSQGGRKKGTGVRRQQSGKLCDTGQLEQVNFSTAGSCRNFAETTNIKHNKDVLHELESVVASSGFEYSGLDVQGGELSCLNGDVGSGGGTMNQKNIEEEHECLEIQRDQSPIDQSTCYWPLEVQKSPGKAEEENAADQHSSELTMCMDETKYYIKKAIKTETSSKGFSDKNDFDYRIHENKNDVSHEEQVAITMQDMHGNSIDTRTKPLEESRSNEYAGVPKIEKCGIDPGMGLAETLSSSVSCGKLHSQKGFQYGRELIDIKDGSEKLNMEILKFEEQSEKIILHPETRTAEMHLDEFAKSGMSIETLDPCRTEHRDNELHDMISATSHADPTGIVGQQELGKRKAKRKGKLKGKSEFPEAGLDVTEVTVGSVNMLQDGNAVKKMRKSKWKKAEKSIYTQWRNSNLQNRRKLLDADGSDQLFVSEDLLPGQTERKASPEPKELEGKDTAISVKEKAVEHVSFETEGLESMLLHGKNQARKNVKNISGGNKKTELMSSIRERKRKAVRQKNNSSDKKSLYHKSNCVRKGLGNSLRNNDKPGEVLCSLSSNNDPNSFRTTEQQKEDVGDLDGIKGQSDSSTDAASLMKTVHSSSSVQTNCELKPELSNFSQDLTENLLLENKTLERQRMVGCDNGVVGEDISSGVNEEGTNMIANAVRKCDKNVKGQCEQPRVGWALCDDCQKWRCIPGELADAIDESDCKCSCQGNPNREFADCSIPQVESNAEINAELNISDVSCEEGDWNGTPIELNNLACMQAQDSQQAAWTLIKHNMYLHRSRKTPINDEMMVCHCKPPKDGSLGCGDECLNRMLNIECVQGTCPCGDLCSNQQFQKQEYAKIRCFRRGTNCFGLQALEDVAKGMFLIEYVGEVLDIQAYEARRKEYASRSQMHAYFMTLNRIEVIDACVKGNLGRFINHSCDPNCQTEKWMVNGEVCIGLFAIRDIKKGEELTFDYNYLRVIGAAVKKCDCGSAECRGFIGSDPFSPAAVLPNDLDENCEVPGMIKEDSENEGSQDNKVLSTRECSAWGNVAEGEHSSQPSERKSECSSALFEKQAEVSNNFGITRKVNTVSNLGNAFNLEKSRDPTNIECFEEVEEKLNELLDSKGGICRDKDAAKDYLKLLLVTAASGDTEHGEVSHSIRDVSMVLDALLQTRSQTVLIDIMNKNGLQMLHNILKQNCKNYIKTPIVCKLLKVIEFLAENDVLSVDQINSGPACRDSESFKTFICALTGHNDSQVQQIAQRFRDNCIPRIIKNTENKEGLNLNKVGLIFDDYELNSCRLSVKQPKMVPRQTYAIDCISQTPVEQENVADSLISMSDRYEVSHGTHENSPGQDGSEKLNRKNALDGWKTGKKVRKRKSRWDQPTGIITQEISFQTNLRCGESNVENGKDSGSLILQCDKENNVETDQDVSTSGGKWSSEQNHVTNIHGNSSCPGTAVQSAISSCPPSEDMCMSNAPGTSVKEQSSLQFPMQQTVQMPGRVDSCVGSSCTVPCSTDTPATQPYMMPPHLKTVYGYPLKCQGNILPHWPLSYGIPVFLLGNLGRSPTTLLDGMSQPLSAHRPHCPSSNNPISSTVIPNMRPCPAQPVMGCFPRNPQHQLQPFNISLPMQSAAHPLQNVRQQPFQMHPGQAVRQCASDNPDYLEPEPPVPGLSPSRSSETPCNSNWPVRGRNKVGHGQTGKPGKRQGKQQRFNYPRFSNYKGPSDRKYKDCFPQKKYPSFKATWKNRLSSNFHKNCSPHHLSNENSLHLQNLQQNSEHVNIANFPEAVSKNFSTFH